MNAVTKFPQELQSQRWRERRGRGPVGHQGDGFPELPVDHETENAVVSLCVRDGAEMLARGAKVGLSQRWFSTAGRRKVYEVVERLVVAGTPVDIGVIATELRNAGELEVVGGFEGLAEMTGVNPAVGQTGFYLGKLRALALRREVIVAAQEAARAARDFAGDGAEVDEFCAAQEERILGVMRQRVGAGAARGGALPQLMQWGDLVGAEPRVEPPQLVAGMIHRGGKVMLGGGSKSFKTWVLVDLGLSVATGTPWWGMRTAPGRVLFVNFELQTWSFERRVREIAKAKGIEGAPNFVSWHLRGHARDLAQLIPQFLTQTVGSKFDMIILDPIYKCLGDRDENANGEVSALLNEVEALAVRSEASVVFGHHFSKGNQAAKDARDRVSGAGAWTRDPDTVITLTPHEEEGAFAVECVLRDMKPKEPMTVRWKMPCMEVAPGLDPAKLRAPGAPQKATAHDVALVIEPGEMLTDSEWEKRAVKELKISESSYKRYKAKALELGLVERSGNVYRAKRG